MVNERMRGLGDEPSAIRELFAYGMARKAEIGVENIVITPMSETGEADGGSGSGEEGTDAASSETPTPEATETPEE